MSDDNNIPEDEEPEDPTEITLEVQDSTLGASSEFTDED
jgi:hypothetical protein